MRVCLDFDGVLHDAANPVPGRKMGPPIDGAVGAVLLMVDAGHEVIVHSARVTAESQFGHVQRWLEFYGFPEIPVYVHKPLADVYVDDKAIHFTGDWATALSELEEIDRNGHTAGRRPTTSDRARGRRNRPSARGGDRQRGARLPRTRLSGQGDG